MINDENRTQYQALFFVGILGILAFLGVYVTWAMAIYIAVVFAFVALSFIFPLIFWLSIIGLAIWGGYYINYNFYPLV